jgi:molecular chaperone HscB
MIDFSRNHFELFGLPASFAIDVAALDRAWRELQAEVHPDRHAAADDASRRLALQASARVNEAYRALKDPVERGRYLLHLRGIDAFDETDTRLALDFLEAQLERREQAADAAKQGDVETLDDIVADIRAEARERERDLAALLGQPGDGARATAVLRELRFLAKVAEDVGAMAEALDA